MEHDRDSYSYSWLSLRFGLPLFFVSQNAMPAEAAGGDGVLAVAGRGEGRENKWACARRSACYELRCLLLLSPPPLSSSALVPYVALSDQKAPHREGIKRLLVKRLLLNAF